MVNNTRRVKIAPEQILSAPDLSHVGRDKELPCIFAVELALRSFPSSFFFVSDANSNCDASDQKSSQRYFKSLRAAVRHFTRNAQD